jgi:unsaturated rhamnogalacturonyl hydrolase
MVRAMKSLAIVCCLAGLLHLTTHAVPANEALLRSVADSVLQQSTRRLIDHRSGETHRDSVHLKPAAEISVESKFNAWFYQTWLLADGMRHVAEALGEPRYRSYGEANLDFFYQHLPFFEAQHQAGFKAAPAGDGKLSPVGLHFETTSLWHTGLAPLVIERHASTGDSRYLPYLHRLDVFLRANPRFPDGTLYRPGKGLMTDDVYMTVPLLVRKWRATGQGEFLEDAAQQVSGTYQRLLDPQSRLLRHLWDLETGAPAGEFWGRGNGWAALACCDLLDALPAEHPLRPRILEVFRTHMDGIRRCGDPAGGWHQVLDHSESWLETSATGMLTFVLARGVNVGWLDRSFLDTARRGWEALAHKVVQQNGLADLIDVCASTDTGSLDYYLSRPRLQGDLHGFGSFLLAGAEICRATHTP